MTIGIALHTPISAGGTPRSKSCSAPPPSPWRVRHRDAVEASTGHLRRAALPEEPPSTGGGDLRHCTGGLGYLSADCLVIVASALIDFLLPKRFKEGGFQPAGA